MQTIKDNFKVIGEIKVKVLRVGNSYYLVMPNGLIPVNNEVMQDVQEEE